MLPWSSVKRAIAIRRIRMCAFRRLPRISTAMRSHIVDPVCCTQILTGLTGTTMGKGGRGVGSGSVADKDDPDYGYC